VAPGHGTGRQRGEQEVAQDGPVDLRAQALAALRAAVDEDGARLVHHPHVLALRQGVGQELLEEPVVVQGPLAGPDVQVQQAALVARVRPGVQFVDGGGDAVPMQDARQDQAAEAGAHDGDAGKDMGLPAVEVRAVWSSGAELDCSRGYADA
jgi:hypothetical protein